MLVGNRKDDTMIKMYSAKRGIVPGVVYNGTNGQDVLRLINENLQHIDKNCMAFSYMTDGAGHLYEKVYSDVNDNKVTAKECVKGVMYIILDDKLYTLGDALYRALFNEEEGQTC